MLLLLRLLVLLLAMLLLVLIAWLIGALGGTSKPAAELSRRVNDIAAAGTKFITVYGGLAWTKTHKSPQDEFWNLWTATIGKLSPSIVPVGAQEMARLMREAKQMQ